MNIDINHLLSENNFLKLSIAETINQLNEEKIKLAEAQKLLDAEKAKNNYLIEQFRLAQQKRFGKSAEPYPGQDQLFNEAEALVEELALIPAEADQATETDQTLEAGCYQRRKPIRKPLPKDLPREVIVHDIAEADKICACCGGTLHPMGEDKSEQLEFIPAQVKVIEHIRPKYSCRQCENTGTEVAIKQAPVALSVIPKSFATASLLSQLITSKYQYALPLYRQESLFKQHGIELSRQTMADWIVRSAELLRPLYHRFHQLLLEQSVIHADETPIKVLKEDKATCYMWLYCSGSDSPALPKEDVAENTTENTSENTTTNIVLYDYQNNRASNNPITFLKDYESYLQVDGYAAYESTNAILVGCMAHARRKFKEAQAVQPKGKTGKADWALSHLQKLYRIEAEIKDKTAAEKYQYRQQHSRPLLDQFKAWLDQSVLQTAPKGLLGQALGYSLKQWPKLIRYLEDGRLSIDNNRAERAIKPFVIGRKNWLFANTSKGAQASAILYSVIETAKANGLMPFDYLRICLTHLSTKPNEINSILPWNMKLV